MIVYSKKIISFINEIKQTTKEILSKEIGLHVERNRFYNRERTSFPITIVIYNDASHLGYFDPDFYELGFHECLMNASRQDLHNVIRHELAHYILFTHHAPTFHAHSDEFKSFCKKMGWAEDVQRASMSIQSLESDTHDQESAALRKVKKLLALATSSNIHEAEQAMIMSQQILLKHHIEAPSLENEETEKIVLKRIMKQKRIGAKIHAIGNILTTFFVNIVYSRANGYTYLELLGDSVNVSIAEYVASVLDHQLDILWNQAQKNSSIRGRIAKNSFFFGVAKGYCDKVRSHKQISEKELLRALIVIEKKLDQARAMAYPHLTKGKSHSLYCKETSLLGEKIGKELFINPAINTTAEQSNKKHLIEFHL